MVRWGSSCVGGRRWEETASERTGRAGWGLVVVRVEGMVVCVVVGEGWILVLGWVQRRGGSGEDGGVLGDLTRRVVRWVKEQGRKIAWRERGHLAVREEEWVWRSARTVVEGSNGDGGPRTRLWKWKSRQQKGEELRENLIQRVEQ
ncbi:hypothetical protein LINPERPRIM_LOCUS16988 [Linum perenne]